MTKYARLDTISGAPNRTRPGTRLPCQRHPTSRRTRTDSTPHASTVTTSLLLTNPHTPACMNPMNRMFSPSDAARVTSEYPT